LRHLRFSVIDAEDWSVAGLANSNVSKEPGDFIFWGSRVLEQEPHTGRPGNACVLCDKVSGVENWTSGGWGVKSWTPSVSPSQGHYVINELCASM
jgi:hypothetical protein